LVYEYRTKKRANKRENPNLVALDDVYEKYSLNSNLGLKKHTGSNSAVRQTSTNRGPTSKIILQPKLGIKILGKNVAKKNLSIERSSVLDVPEQYKQSVAQEVKPLKLDKYDL
jgi:hypothetical protein